MHLYDAIRPVLFRLPPEPAHRLGKGVLQLVGATGLTRGPIRSLYQYRHPALEIERFGATFPNPVGIAAGFDKNGEVARSLADLGFGFAEIGTVTPEPQEGNPHPRLFRLPEDDGMINRLAFNSAGVDRVRDRLAALGDLPVPLSVNIGKMNDSGPEEAISDYLRVFETLYDYPDYFVVNVSCPNTPEVYDEASPEHLADVFSALQSANADGKPIVVKIGPDYEKIEDLAELVGIVEEFDLDGIVATNTTEDHDGLSSRHRDEWGGVSGKPLEEKATSAVERLYRLTDLPLVGVGGVDSAESAYRKIRAGASLVQLYTGFVYRGPSLAREITTGLVDLLEADGFSSVEEAVGVDVD